VGYKQRTAIAIVEGGTNTDTFTNTNGTVIYNGTNLATVFPGVAGQVLTSGGASAPSFQNFTGAGITTLDGDTGSTSDLTVLIAGGSNITTSATASTLTVDLNNTVSVSGSMTAGTGLVATTGGLTVSAGTITTPFTTTGSLVSDTSGVITNTNASTAGFILTSNGAATVPTFQAAGPGGIVTLDGTTGSATGSVVTVQGSNSNIVTSASGSTVSVALANSPSVSGSVTAGTGLVATTGGLTATGNSTINGTGAGTTTIGSSAGGALIFASGAASSITLTNQPLTINTGTGDITIGDSSNTKNISIEGRNGTIDIGTSHDFSANAINIGSTNTSWTGALNLQTGTGDINIGSTGGNNKDITIGASGTITQTLTLLAGDGSSGGYLRIGTSGDTQIDLGSSSLVNGSMRLRTASSLELGANANAQTITIGNTTGSTGIAMRVGSSGLTIPSFTTTGSLVSNTSGLITNTNASTAGFVLTSNGAASVPTFQAAGGGGGIDNVDQTSTPVTMVVNSHYSMNLGSLITATLPATAAFGSVIKVSGYGAGLWTIAQNSGQTIHFGSVNTTTGVGGSLSSTNRYDSIELFCAVADTNFVVQSSIGNITYV